MIKVTGKSSQRHIVGVKTQCEKNTVEEIS